MGLLIDSSVLIEIERSGAAPVTLLESVGDQAAFLAAITASELLHGVHRADTALRRGRRERFVEAVFDALAVLSFDLETARIHSRVWADLARRGEMIGAHDLLIAATALKHGLAVVTGNVREFGRVEDLDVVLWTMEACHPRARRTATC